MDKFFIFISCKVRPVFIFSLWKNYLNRFLALTFFNYFINTWSRILAVLRPPDGNCFFLCLYINKPRKKYQLGYYCFLHIRRFICRFDLFFYPIPEVLLLLHFSHFCPGKRFLNQSFLFSQYF